MARILSFVLAALVLSANALTTPLVARGNHLQLAARLAAREPEPIAEPAPELGLSNLTRRAKRCSPQKPVASSSGGGAVNVAPAPSTASDPTPSSPPPSAQPPPAHTHTHTSSSASEQPSPDPTSSAPPPADSNKPCGPMSLTGTMSGDGTFYAPGLGSCGMTNSTSQFIVAVSWELYDTYPGYAGPGTNPNNNPICGKRIRAEYQGKTVEVEVVDRCTGCACGSLDFSPTAFDQIADPNVGRIHGVTWDYI